MAERLARIPILRRTGAEVFHRAGRPLGFDLLDFWRWASSDLISNSLRGVVAEYLVARALGLAEGTRAPWDACDLCTPEGARVEVKSSAYLQSWYQAAPSRPTFVIRRTRRWDADTNELDALQQRQADVYVFALLSHRDKATLDPLDLAQWEFYVLPSATLEARCPEQKTIALSSLMKLGPRRADCSTLREAVAATTDRAGAVPPPV